MNTLFWGSVIFCSAFILHVIIWKVRIPKNQTKILLMIFFGTLCAGFIVLCFLIHLTLAEYLHISLFFISLTLAYITTYSALEVDSPSLVMVMNIAAAGNIGLEKKKFEEITNDDRLVKPRVRDLITDKLAFLEGDRYRLTSRGILVARIFIFYRKLLKAQKGG